MRKQNCSIAPVLKHNGGLNNSVVRGRKGKRPNALKHGFYSEVPLIPGEDPREFQEILAENLRAPLYEMASSSLRT